MNSDHVKSAKALEAFLHTYVPLAQAAKIRVDAYDGQNLQVSAPLEDNINDKGTAFGGSLYNVCVITGWGLTSLLCKEFGFDGDIVVAKAEIDYLTPCKKDLHAFVQRPPDEILEIFCERFKRKKRAALSHAVEIRNEHDELCVRFTGKYAIVA